MKHPLFLSLLSCATLATPHMVMAKDAPQKDEFQFSIGAAVAFTPEEYEGSDDHEWQALPLINASWQPQEKIYKTEHGERMLLGIQHVSFGKNGLDIGIAKFITRKMVWDISTGLGYHFERDAGNHRNLQGMGDIDGYVTGKLTAKMHLRTLEDLEFTFTLEQDLQGETDGLTVNADVGYNISLSRQWKLSPSVAVTWADDDYMQSYFGVSNTQSPTSGYAPYTAQYGIKDVSLGLSTLYFIDKQWSLFGSAEYKKLLSDAAHSPLVKAGSEHQWSAISGISYRF